MRTLLSTASGPDCVDCQPNESRQRVIIALAILGLTTLAIVVWRMLLEHLGDPLVAAMLLAVVSVTFVAPAAKLFRS